MEIKRVTVSNLHKRSAQQVFDYIANHLIVQNKRSLGPDGHNCVYRDEIHGLSCAAGCLFTQRTYRKYHENQSWRSLTRNNGVPGEHEDLISELQFIHDGNAPADWKTELKKVARRRLLAWRF